MPSEASARFSCCSTSKTVPVTKPDSSTSPARTGATQPAPDSAPASTAEALASLSWAAAAALVRGGLHPACFEAAALADPMLRAIETRVTLRAAG